MTWGGAVTASWWYLDDDQLEAFLLGLLDGTAWWLGVVLALAAGALHAIGPGHGKTLVGAYLAGSRGRPGDAVALGGLVAIMHTGSVLVVGMLFAATQQVPAGERLEGVLRLVSAVAVTVVGVWLLRRALLRRRATSVSRGRETNGMTSEHVHEPGVGSAPEAGSTREEGHEHAPEAGSASDLADEHAPEAGSALDPTHEHLAHHHAPPEGVAPMSRAGIAAIATSGGLLPSPAAFLVLATAIAIGRTTYGLVLVGAFGIGLALTLTAVGLAVLWGRDRLAARASTRAGRAVGLLPLVASVGVILGGLWLAVLAVRAI